MTSIPDKCAACGAHVEPIDSFPGDLCMDCYAARMESLPVGELPPPDFAGTLAV